MKLIAWQFYWRRWHLSASVYYDEVFDIYDFIIAIGPLQLWFRQ